MTDDLYTPPPLADLARQVLGEIDLDPATDDSGHSCILAGRRFTEDDDGLSQPWHGRVWLFPPHDGRRAAWVLKLLHEYRLGRVSAALLYTVLDSRAAWFHHLAAIAPVCFLNGAMQATRPSGAPLERLRYGAILAYLGPEAPRFRTAVAGLGTTMRSVP